MTKEEELRQALIHLANEASGMIGMSGFREFAGNTNFNCLQTRINKARELTMKSPREIDVEEAYELITDGVWGPGSIEPEEIRNILCKLWVKAYVLGGGVEADRNYEKYTHRYD